MASLNFSESPEYITIANKPMGEENYEYQLVRLTITYGCIAVEYQSEVGLQMRGGD